MRVESGCMEVFSLFHFGVVSYLWEIVFSLCDCLYAGLLGLEKYVDAVWECFMSRSFTIIIIGGWEFEQMSIKYLNKTRHKSIKVWKHLVYLTPLSEHILDWVIENLKLLMTTTNFTLFLSFQMMFNLKIYQYG